MSACLVCAPCHLSLLSADGVPSYSFPFLLCVRPRGLGPVCCTFLLEPLLDFVFAPLLHILPSTLSCSTVFFKVMSFHTLVVTFFVILCIMLPALFGNHVALFLIDGALYCLMDCPCLLFPFCSLSTAFFSHTQYFLLLQIQGTDALIFGLTIAFHPVSTFFLF